MAEPEPPQKAAQKQGEQSADLEVPGSFGSEALHGSQPDLRDQEAARSLENLRPSNQREHELRPVPDVVERDNESAEVQQQEALEEDSGIAASGESLIERDPGFGLTQMRKANHKERDRREELSGVLHQS